MWCKKGNISHEHIRNCPAVFLHVMQNFCHPLSGQTFGQKLRNEQKHRKNTYGKTVFYFTLIELMIVVAIIAVLASLLLPALSRARMTAQKIKCTGNTRQLAQAMIVYAGDYKDWTAIDTWNHSKFAQQDEWFGNFRIKRDNDVFVGHGRLFKDGYADYKIGICPLDVSSSKSLVDTTEFSVYRDRWLAEESTDGKWVNSSYQFTYSRRIIGENFALFCDNLNYIGVSGFYYNHRHSGMLDINVSYSDGSSHTIKDLQRLGTIRLWQECIGPAVNLFYLHLTYSYGSNILKTNPAINVWEQIPSYARPF